MRLVLEAVVAELDEAGHFKSRLFDYGGLVIRLTGTEIDGVQFKLEDLGTTIDLVMESGEDVELSANINTNYPAPPHSPVKQISFSHPVAKFTANTLNKFLRRVNKNFPGTALLIRDVKGLSYD